jgi:hypothetical protein
LIYFLIPWLRERGAAPLQEWLPEEKPPPAVTSVHRSRNYNYEFTLPVPPWTMDEAARGRLKANLLAMHRTHPDAWLALAARDYGQRSPRESELTDDALARLAGSFANLDWEAKPEAAIGGQRARHLLFQGQVGDRLMRGDAFLLSHQGIAYTILTWAPAEAAKEVEGELEHVRQGFALLHDRDDWKEPQPTGQTFQGVKASYTLTDPSARWQKWPEPQDADPEADFLLHGRDRDDSEAVDKMASVLVLVLPAAHDLEAAVTQAKDHLLRQQQKDHPKTTMGEASPASEQTEQPDRIGKALGRLIQLHIHNGENRERFVILAIVPLKTSVLAIQCECDWKRRASWEKEFRQLLNTLTVPDSQRPG